MVKAGLAHMALEALIQDEQTIGIAQNPRAG